MVSIRTGMEDNMEWWVNSRYGGQQRKVSKNYKLGEQQRMVSKRIGMHISK